MSKIEVIETGLEGTTSERKIYSVDFAGCGVSTLASATAAAYDEVDEDDVSATVFPTNSPSVSSAVATLSPLRELTKGHTYRIEVLGVEGSSYHEAYFRVECVK
jgi:hypothetical protein